MENNLQKVLFIDLDGTIITTKSGREFPIHSDDWKLLPTTLDALTYFYNLNYKIIIVTNQGGISLGYVSEKVFINKIENICKKIEKILKFKEGTISYSYCKDMESFNRKPNPGMAFDNLSEYNLTLQDSIMIGDFQSDEDFSINAGISKFIHVDNLIDFL